MATATVVEVTLLADLDNQLYRGRVALVGKEEKGTLGRRVTCLGLGRRRDGEFAHWAPVCVTQGIEDCWAFSVVRDLRAKFSLSASLCHPTPNG